MKKEIMIVVRYPGNLFMSVGVMYLVFVQLLYMSRALGGGGQNLQQVAGTENYLGFAVVGFLLWNVLIKALGDICVSVGRDAMTGCLEHVFLSPVHSLALFFSRGIASVLTTIVFLLMLLIPINLTRHLGLGGSLLPLVVVLLLAMAAIYGFCFALAGLAVLYKQISSAVQLLNFVFLFLCGVIYPLELLPRFLQIAGEWMPITYAVNGLRQVVLTGAQLGDLAGSGLLWKLSTLSASYLAAGIAIYLGCVQVALRRGSLNQY